MAKVAATLSTTPFPDWKSGIIIGYDGKFKDDKNTILKMFKEAIYRASTRPPNRQRALAYSPSSNPAGPFEEITWAQYEVAARRVGKSLMSLGVGSGDAVAIIGFNCKEWFYSFMGSCYVRAAIAGVYTTNSPDITEYTLNHCKAKVAIVEPKQITKFQNIAHLLPSLLRLIVWTPEGESYGGEVSSLSGPEGKSIPVIRFEEFQELGKDVTDEELDARSQELCPEDLAALVYTSGTTGPPKGVMITHGNLVNSINIMGIEHVQRNSPLIVERENRIISFLPLSHILAFLTDCVLPCSIPEACVFFATPGALKGDIVISLCAVRPTFFVSVPRLYEKMYEKMMAVRRTTPALLLAISGKCKNIAGKRHKNFAYGGSQKTPFGYKLAKKILKQIHVKLGLDECEVIISGGAPLAEYVKDYFASIDLPICEGFGMSETTGPHTCSYMNATRSGTCGRALLAHSGDPNEEVVGDPNLKGAQMRIDPETQEIQLKGPNITQGYFNDPEKTKEAFTSDGWLKTGDLGKIDADGFLSITGRIKELIITAGGENIPPVLIEAAMKKAMPIVSGCVVIGDRRKFLSMLVTLKVKPNKDGLPTDELDSNVADFVKSIGSSATTASAALECDKIIKYIDKTRQEFAILPVDFHIDTGELTPTMKLKRKVISEKYSEQIEAMY